MSLKALEANAYLHHLHLGSPNPERLAGFYANAMAMTAAKHEDSRWLVRGPGRRVHFSKGAAKTLVHAGFAVRDEHSLAALRARAKEQDLAPVDAETLLMNHGAFAVKDPDGNKIIFGVAADEPNPPPGLRGPIQHLTLATRDVGAIENFYADKLGFAVSDRILNEAGKVMTCFMRGNHEHHNLACFYQERQGIDHHSYEAGEWNTIRDWADRLAERDIQLMWGRAATARATISSSLSSIPTTIGSRSRPKSRSFRTAPSSTGSTASARSTCGAAGCCAPEE
jgi:catechol 2,3-dioxygenase